MDTCICYLPRNKPIGEERHYYQNSLLARYVCVKFEVLLLVNVSLAIFLGFAVLDSEKIVNDWYPTSCFITNQTEKAGKVEVDVIYHVADNKPLKASFSFCESYSGDDYTNCVQAYSVGNRFNCLVDPEHKSRVEPTSKAQEDARVALKTFVIVVICALFLPEVIYFFAVTINVIVKRATGQPVPSAPCCGPIGTIFVTGVEMLLGRKEYIREIYRNEPLLNISRENSSFIQQFSLIKRMTLVEEMDDEEEILWTCLPTKKQILVRPGTTRMLEYFTIVVLVVTIPSFVLFGILVDAHKGWFFTFSWVELCILIKLICIILAGLNQSYVLTSSRLLVISRGPFDIHVHSYPLDSRIKFKKYSDGSGCLVYDVADKHVIIAECVPFVTEIQNILKAQLQRIGGESYPTLLFADDPEMSESLKEPELLTDDDFVI